MRCGNERTNQTESGIKEMGFVTKEQIERARQVNVLDYILAYESDNIYSVGSGYRLKDHESLAVTNGKWYWHSRGFGGKTALDYLTDVRDYGLVEAVCMLLGEKPIEKSTTKNVKLPPGNKPFILPLRNKDNNRVIAYLQSRGIDKSLILCCIEQGHLYENAYRHDCIFTGKDEHGKTRYAAMRSTTSDFKRDADGSDKKYGFILSPNNPNNHEIAVFESPIDTLSHQTICKQGYISPFDGWRLSLGGTSILALEHFLKTHTEVTHCHICTDNDNAGEMAAAKITKIPGITSVHSPPTQGNDWNDTLQSIQKAKHIKDKTLYKNIPNL